MNKLKNEISTELKNSMKEKNADLTSTYRGIISKITEAEKNNNNSEISDDLILKIIEKLAKQREEAIVLYEKGGREDLASKERFELSVLVKYLPQKMDETLTRNAVKEAVDNGASNIGLLMGLLTKTYGNLIDKKLASVIAKEFI